MIVINATNVNNAFAQAMEMLDERRNSPNELRSKTSRVGAVLAFPEPVTTVYSRPLERVLFSPMRNANPFFHFMESLWMIYGGQDLEFPLLFNKRFHEYSRPGSGVIHGAYGHRWRNHFCRDQIRFVIDELIRNPNSRRAVISMWDPIVDIPEVVGGGPDVPCNTHIYFSTFGDVLDMTVCCRSNDIVWGCYGANAVHFSILHEYVARAGAFSVGTYTHVSNDLHIYTDIYKPDSFGALASDARNWDLYTMGVEASGAPIYDTDLVKFFTSDHPAREGVYTTHMFLSTAQPMYESWTLYKSGMIDDALDIACSIQADDWRAACIAWLLRVQEKRNAPKQA